MDRMAANHLFDQLFALRYKRQPQTWEAVLGLALVTGELVVQRVPAAPELARVHHVAADVELALQGQCRVFKTRTGHTFIVEEREGELFIRADGPVFVHWYPGHDTLEVRPLPPIACDSLK
jgi:hypothetical protein